MISEDNPNLNRELVTNVLKNYNSKDYESTVDQCLKLFNLVNDGDGYIEDLQAEGAQPGRKAARRKNNK